jgi:hypothetical protein
MLLVIDPYNGAVHWNNLSIHSTNELNFITSIYQYKQLIDDPTRETIHSKTLIDHFYSNKKENIVAAGVSKISISDHYLIYGIRKFPSLKGGEHIIEFRDSKHFNEDNFLHDISSLILSILNVESYRDPNQMWYVWKSKFTEIIDKHAPLKTRKIGKKCTPWITKQILFSKRHKNLLKKKASKSKTESDWQDFDKIYSTKFV